MNTMHRETRKHRPKRICWRAHEPIRDGTATLELVLLLPLIVLFGLASADFGRIAHAYLVVANAARTGAEYGSTHGFTSFSAASWESRVRQAVQTEMQGLGGFNAADLQIDVPTPAADTDGLYLVHVAVSYPFRTIVNWPGLSAMTMLHHEVQMRQIR
jgi:Flp pilus assembly protein TadG